MCVVCAIMSISSNAQPSTSLISLRISNFSIEISFFSQMWEIHAFVLLPYKESEKLNNKYFYRMQNMQFCYLRLWTFSGIDKTCWGTFKAEQTVLCLILIALLFFKTWEISIFSLWFSNISVSVWLVDICSCFHAAAFKINAFCAPLYRKHSQQLRKDRDVCMQKKI